MSNYNVITTTRKALPRSKRLRAAGGYSGSSTVVNVGGGGGGGTSTCDGHTHPNKAALDAISIDNDFYLWLTQKLAGADDSTTQKIKAGFADDSNKWNGKTFGEYLDQPVRRNDIVAFAKVVAALMQSPDFIPGMEVGAGWGFNEYGTLEVPGLIARGFIKTPKLIYNKVQVTGGEMWNTEGGCIKTVTPDPDSDTAFTLLLDIEDGDTVELDVDDICKGHFNSSGGFITSYFRVTYVDAAANSIRVVLGNDAEVPGGENFAPVPFMNIARMGNFDDGKPERQCSQYFSSSELRIVLLRGVNTYIISQQNYRGVFGTVPSGLIPSNLPVGAGDVSFYGKYGLFEKILEIDVNGDIIRKVRDRGLWSAAVASGNDPYACTSTGQDEVYHNSCKYRCILNGTLQEPKYDATDWLLVAGDTELKMDIDSSNGNTFLAGRIDTVLTATVKRGLTDITSDILTVDWSWTRRSGNVEADSAWNANHSAGGNTIHITNGDITGRTGKIVCTAYVRDGIPVSAELNF